MKLYVFSLILLVIGHHLYGQRNMLRGDELKHYQKISKRSRTAPNDFMYSTYYLSNYLIQPTKTDLEKVRSIYVWVANNITYDMEGFKKNKLPDYRPKAVLVNKYAVCEGFARLFNEMCREAGLRSEIIRGYSRGYGYTPGDKFEVSNHAWNAVLLDGKWQFIDVTWAARNTNDSKIIRPLDDKHFLSQPEDFIKDHLPEIPAWQLLSRPISKKEFEENRILVIDGNFNFKDSLASLIDLNPTEKAITYQLKAKKFNPDNPTTNYKLGVEYRFRALDSLGAVYYVEEGEMERFNQLEEQVFTDLDEAALYFTLIKPSSRYYESAQNFLDDTDYERGVFKYEAAHRMLEIFNTFSEVKKQKMWSKYESKILQYYKEAAVYFELISTNSWYYESATKYIRYYLDNPFEDL